jgi:LysM repeat protein
VPRPPLRHLAATALVLAVLAAGAPATADDVEVRPGDTLSAIAVRLGTTIAALAEANGLADPDRIRAGQRLRVPGGAPASPAPSAEGVRVRPGDTLSAIAVRLGTTIAALAEANGLADPDRIRAGQRLRVPGGAPAPPAPPSGGFGNAATWGGPTDLVRPGDTVASVARRNGVAAADLARWNGIVDGRLYAGARLVLRDPGSPPPARSGGSGATHRVRAGETLSAIAVALGTTVRALADANGLADPDRVTVGRRLVVPGGASTVRCPVPGAWFVNDWGFPRSGGRAHSGNDLFAPAGTPMLAPVAGTVTTSVGEIGGRQVRLVDATGTRWYGTHLSGFGATGAVSAGEVIGFVGDSGNARGTRPHVHLEIHPPGRGPVNPYPLLAEVC